jgi:hypothetical protein
MRGGDMNHPVGTTDAIATLTRFSRTLSTATDPAEMLQLLARASECEQESRQGLERVHLVAVGAKISA